MGLSYYRTVAQIDQHGNFHFTRTNAYSGNNGRAAILNNSLGVNLFYMVANAGNGWQPPVKAEVAQSPEIPRPS